MTADQQIKRNYPPPLSGSDLAARAATSLTPDFVRDQLNAAFGRPGAATWLREIDAAGMLDRLLPELVPMKGCAQPKEHYWDVFDHSIETVAAVDRTVAALPATARGDRPDSGLSAEGAAWLSAELAGPDETGAQLRLTRLSALLHDVAKPATKAVQPDGRTRFFGHPERGAEMCRDLLGRLGYPPAEIEFVATLVDMHLRPGQLGAEDRTDRALRRLFRDAGPGIAGLLVLNLADHAAAQGPRLTDVGWNLHLAVIDDIIRRGTAPPPPKPVRLVTGHDLMAGLDIEPGPGLGRLLDMIEAAQAAGEIATPEDALDLARRLHRE